MKLIKLSDEHYVIVDEVKEIDPSSPSNGHWCYVLHKPSNTILEVNLIGEQMGNMTVIDETLRNKREVLYKEVVPIIAASETMEFHPKESMKLIPLSEVEEAIYGYSVDKMADEEFPHIEIGLKKPLKREEIPYVPRKQREAYELGFNAHKELVKDKLFTADDIRKELASLALEIATEDGELSSCSPSLIYSWIENRIKSLLPKTEWEVEFDEQGKIKLL